MVRQRSRRTIEEVYGTKFETPKPSSANNAKNPGYQTNVHDHGYIINSNTPYYTTPALAAPQSSLTSNGALNTSRRKTTATTTTARNNGKLPTGGGTSHKTGSSKEKEDISKDFNTTKMKTSRAGHEIGHEKSSYVGTGVNQYHDNKTYRPYNELNKEYRNVTTGSHQQQHHHHNHQPANQQQHHPHHHHQQDEDKDDDTEEFFQLIRQTVENAIGKSISELLNRNFRELSSKIDRFQGELKNTNDQLKKIHMELSNKIVHYGEENSRHFRYLCMKSEYDKMFYQHQTMMSATALPSNNHSTKHNKRMSPRQSKPSPNQSPTSSENDVLLAPCTCRSTMNNKTPQKISTKDPQKSLSNERTASDICEKSSDVGLREILDQLQRFFMEMKELKQCPNTSTRGNSDMTYRREKAIRINKELFHGGFDDDDFEMSSDSISPRSVDNLDIPQQYGGMTVRTSSTTRTQHMSGGGGGDGGDAS
ncbi:rho GTPase-activating protein gacF [Musca vetustissima]|uniref:rho GTPase-activating protein gacF n=1 Tax=Musca vetustissima TaxID=27455 RepID=UPI002AB6924F|nr:rho GTPase-activating protein gacF [Musca vetustissima]